MAHKSTVLKIHRVSSFLNGAKDCLQIFDIIDNSGIIGYRFESIGIVMYFEAQQREFDDGFKL